MAEIDSPISIRCRSTSKSTKRLGLVVALSFIATTQSFAQESSPVQQTISAGAYYSNGDYGEESDTSIYYFPVTYDAQVGRWGFQLQVPHIEVEGLGNVLVNVGGVTQAVAGERTVSSGLGDTTAAVIYQLDPLFAKGPFIDLRLDVKLPTADETKSLGTGESDYGFQVDMYQSFGSVNGFASLGYRWRGRSELFTGLQNSAYAQLGFTTPVSDSVSMGLIYDYRESASAFNGESHELLPYLSWQFARNWTFTSFASWGFTDASPDIAVIGQISYRW